MTTDIANDATCCVPGGCCCCKSCCCTMPHGKLSTLFPLITLTIAATISFIGLWSCYYVEADVLVVDTWDEGGWNYTTTEGAGFWSNCMYYYSGDSDARQQDFEEDPARKVAMSFGLLACIVGIVAMVALWPITCKPYRKKSIRIICSAVVFAFVSQLVTFSMFGTEFCKENECVFGWGGIFSTIAAVLYLISAITVWKIPEPVEASTDAANNDTVQLNETELPDGTMVTEKTTTSPDGTKTIEKTIVKPTDRRGGIEQPPQQTGDALVDHAVAVETEV